MKDDDDRLGVKDFVGELLEFVVGIGCLILLGATVAFMLFILTGGPR